MKRGTYVRTFLFHKKCLKCGNEFTAKVGCAKYCQECNNHICIYCGKKFFRKATDRKDLYCSRKCNGLGLIGAKQTEESNKKRSKTLLDGYKTGRIKKQIHSEEQRKKNSEFHKGLHLGDKHPMWNGGITIGSNGYILKYCPEHPKKLKKCYVYEHILVMEEKIGRYLIKGEIVHHINGIKTDNRPENLMLFKSHHDHLTFHRKYFNVWKNNGKKKI